MPLCKTLVKVYDAEINGPIKAGGNLDDYWVCRYKFRNLDDYWIRRYKFRRLFVSYYSARYTRKDVEREFAKDLMRLWKSR